MSCLEGVGVPLADYYSANKSGCAVIVCCRASTSSGATTAPTLLLYFPLFVGAVSSVMGAEIYI